MQVVSRTLWYYYIQVQSHPQGLIFPSHRTGTIEVPFASTLNARLHFCWLLPAPQRQPEFPEISTTASLVCLCLSLRPSSLFLFSLSLSPTNRRFP